ncbi:hypothetical protein [uncultured Bifidobacterium sp.]|uniref:hypothetical protein n=1 Tax=uncultured Bifidobacterium sp. TaxID=165187 RepID=UPI00259909C1|nr:hypothetical protein [uncultured Bifidobacterium sp.]
MDSKLCLDIPRDRGCSMMRCADELDETSCVLVVFPPCDADTLRFAKRMIDDRLNVMIAAVEHDSNERGVIVR